VIENILPPYRLAGSLIHQTHKQECPEVLRLVRLASGSLPQDQTFADFRSS